MSTLHQPRQLRLHPSFVKLSTPLGASTGGRPLIGTRRSLYLSTASTTVIRLSLNATSVGVLCHHTSTTRCGTGPKLSWVMASEKALLTITSLTLAIISRMSLSLAFPLVAALRRHQHQSPILISTVLTSATHRTNRTFGATATYRTSKVDHMIGLSSLTPMELTSSATACCGAGSTKAAFLVRLAVRSTMNTTLA